MGSRAVLILLAVLSMGCIEDNERILELELTGDAPGVVSVYVAAASGEPTGELLECRESCAVFADVGARVTLDPVAWDHGNFLGWDRNVDQRACTGTSTCELVLEGDGVLEVAFSHTKAAIELAHLDLVDFPIEVSGRAVSQVYPGGGYTCSGPQCLFIADVGSEVTLRSQSPDAAAQWHEIGTCEGSDVACVVPLVQTDALNATIAANKWYGVSPPQL